MRERIILEELKNNNTYLNLEYFSNMLQVSSRTIYNDIKNLIKYQNKNGYEICQKRGSGYQIIINDNEAFHRYITKELNDIEISPLIRIENIVALILINYDYITIDEIANELKVSRSLIKNELKKVENYFLDKNLQLIKKAHYGIRLNENDINICLLLSDLYLKNNKIVRKCIDERIDFDKFKNVSKILMSNLKNYKLDTNYTELLQIHVFLKILIFRCKNNNTGKIKGESTIYSIIAINVSKVIKQCFNVDFGIEEIKSISFLLKQKTKLNLCDTDLGKSLSNNLIKFLNTLDYEYNTEFSKDEDFKAALLQHTTLLLNRIHENIFFRNPLKEEISVKYPSSFLIAIKFSKILEETYNVKINQDEIGFIATYFAGYMEKQSLKKINRINRIAIVCSSGKGSAYLIQLKLETVFSNSEFKTFSLLEMEEVKSYDPDVIFSVTKLQEDFKVPVVFIKELIDDYELIKIKNIFSKDNYLKSTISLEDKEILKLFNKDFFTIEDEETEYLNIIKKMSLDIENNGYAEKGYSEYVLEREKFLSTIYLNGITIPHPINMCAKKNLISVAIIKNNVEYDKKIPKIIFMVSLIKEDLEFHKNITTVLNYLMNNEGGVNNLYASKNYNEFIIKLNELIL